jgi:riboflavin synthase
MFTGIVEELGSVRSRDGGRFTFSARTVVQDTSIGDSIAHNGCCLTVVELAEDRSWYAVDAVDETLARTTLADLAPGDPVNLERPVRLMDRLGGHLVQGHVDAVGNVLEPAPALKVAVPAHLTRYMVEKGSVTVDGCSLTLVEVGADWFTIAVIPHTAEVTTLGRKGPGDRVNIEVDVMAKHAEKLLAGHLPPTTTPAEEQS